MSVSKLQSQVARARNGLKEHQRELDIKTFKDAKHGMNLVDKAVRKLQSRQDQDAEMVDIGADLEPDQICDTDLMV